MNVDNAGLKFIQSWEALKLKAYADVIGVWTIGYGTIRYPNGIKVKSGDVCTVAQASIYMQNDLKYFEAAINRYVKVILTQNQYNALLSLVYNIGETNFASSTLVKKLNAKDYQGAADQFLVWNKARGLVVKGLTNRRTAERTLFLMK